MSEDRRAALRERIAALPESSRRALAAAIARETGAASRLTAYLVLEHGPAGAPPGAPPTDEQLRAFLAERLPAYMIPARFALLDCLPRTTAGKLDRRALVKEHGTGLETATTTLVAPRTPIEATLSGIWRDVLRVDEVSVHDDFFEIGGDSLLSIRVIARAGREGLRIPIEQFFEHPTIAGLAAALANETAVKEGFAPPEQGVVTGQAPLTPIQHWFLDAIANHRDHWNQAYLVEVESTLDRAALEAVVRLLVTHHDALRLRLLHSDGDWRQEFQPVPAAVPLRFVDLSQHPPESYAERVAAECDAEHASLRISEGSLFRCIMFEGALGWRRMLLLAHHLVVDAVSWDVLLEDLATLLRLTSAGAPLRLPPKTASARDWAARLARSAAEPDVAATARHWLTVIDGAATRVPVDVTGIESGNLAGDAVRSIVALDLADSQRLLNESAPRLGVTPQAMMLGALLLAWRSWTGSDELLLDVEGHGRDVLGDALDVSRTVGWFTTVFPVRLTLPGAPASAPADAVRAVQSILSALPLRGASHGMLRWLVPDERLRQELGAARRPDVLFNYLGARHSHVARDAPIRMATEPHGRTRSPHAPRAYVLEVNAFIEGGRVTFHIEYSRRLHRPATIDRLAEALRVALREIAPIQAPRFELAALDDAAMSLVADLLSEVDDE